MKKKDPCANCGCPLDMRFALKVNGQFYCSEACAQANVPVIGGNIPQEEEHEPTET